MQWSTVRDASLVFGFVVALCAPTIDEFVRDDAARSPAPELRKAAPPPELSPRSLKSLVRLPGAFDRHYMDTFGLRDRLLRARNRLHWFGLGVSPTRTIAKGSDGWIYTRVDRSREAWRSALPMTGAEIAQWTSALEERRAWLESLGVRHLHVVAPNKESIYPEHLPEDWRRIAPDAPTRLDQLIAATRGSAVDLLDLRPALRAARAFDRPGDEVYTRLGSHWNGNGSRAAYAAIMQRVQVHFPRARALEDAELARLYNQGRGDTWGAHLYLSDLLPQREWFLVHEGGRKHELLAQGGEASGPTRTRKPGRPGPRVLVFHDSFGPYLQEALAESFPEATFHWRSRFDRQVVLEERPELVIELYVERTLARIDHPIPLDD
jgi:hypothetical protein